ncbi:thioredoxin [Trypanosoma rangeli]|uniref:Thioredoxin n=1 Tax=Trypanosoma rangeli TaxID=5698 RepID=A0A3R7KYF1_TRYRA|nr:thioredoxin [Trypanosoma rangeli]RNF03835.1 thioredoxin [Trypanosoma rangeli]|eukprot:RNF03835.1 thioredoxin [Trypanosoma rangeli]
MNAVAGYLHRCLLLRRTGMSVLIAPSVTAATSSSLPTSPPSLCATRRHITSFHGQPLEFMHEVNGESAALVYFYTPWSEQCDRAKIKLQALLNIGCSKPRETSETALPATPARPSASSLPPSSLSGEATAAGGKTWSEAIYGARSRADPDAVLKSASELCLQERANGRAVRIIPVNTDENPKLGALHDIRSVPTFVTYRDGHIVGRVEGCSEEQIQQLVKELLQEDGGDTPAADQTSRMRNARESEPAKKPTQK